MNESGLKFGASTAEVQMIMLKMSDALGALNTAARSTVNHIWIDLQVSKFNLCQLTNTHIPN